MIAKEQGGGGGEIIRQAKKNYFQNISNWFTGFNKSFIIFHIPKTKVFVYILVVSFYVFLNTIYHHQYFGHPFTDLKLLKTRLLKIKLNRKITKALFLYNPID